MLGSLFNICSNAKSGSKHFYKKNLPQAEYKEAVLDNTYVHVTELILKNYHPVGAGPVLTPVCWICMAQILQLEPVSRFIATAGATQQQGEEGGVRTKICKGAGVPDLQAGSCAGPMGE
jgi:hypothetical protein